MAAKLSALPVDPPGTMVCGFSLSGSADLAGSVGTGLGLGFGLGCDKAGFGAVFGFSTFTVDGFDSEGLAMFDFLTVSGVFFVAIVGFGLVMPTVCLGLD